MIKTMLAKYKGICADTGAPINVGDEIQFCTVTRKAWITEHGDCRTSTDNGRYISDVIRIGRREFYRNKQGLCIDAPCCGCCTI